MSNHNDKEMHEVYQSDAPSSSSDEEVNTTGSQPSSSVLPTTPSAIKDGRTLTFNQTDIFPARNVNVARGDEIVYFGKISQYTPHKPDIVFHSKTEDGEVVAHVFFRWAGSIKVGIGGSDEMSMQWVEMKRTTLTGAKKSFGFEWKGKSYTLTRTRDEAHGVTGLKKGLMGHYQVIDDATGHVIATYLSESPVGKRTGALTLSSETDHELELLIVAGVASWREKVRRRQRMGSRMVI